MLSGLIAMSPPAAITVSALYSIVRFAGPVESLPVSSSE